MKPLDPPKLAMRRLLIDYLVILFSATITVISAASTDDYDFDSLKVERRAVWDLSELTSDEASIGFKWLWLPDRKHCRESLFLRMVEAVNGDGSSNNDYDGVIAAVAWPNMAVRRPVRIPIDVESFHEDAGKRVRFEVLSHYCKKVYALSPVFKMPGSDGEEVAVPATAAAAAAAAAAVVVVPEEEADEGIMPSPVTEASAYGSAVDQVPPPERASPSSLARHAASAVVAGSALALLARIINAAPISAVEHRRRARAAELVRRRRHPLWLRSNL
jgi:hypothetical protein